MRLFLHLILFIATMVCLASKSNGGTGASDQIWLNVDEITNLDLIISGFCDCYNSIFVPQIDNYTVDTPFTTPLFIFGRSKKNPPKERVCEQLIKFINFGT